jgi:hypothetical protein
MPFQHVNRKGDTYYLHAGTTRTGKPNYWFARKPGEGVIDEVPPGYEVYEKPETGQVLLRKSKPTRISATEYQMVVIAVRRDAGLSHFRVEVEGDSLVVYTPNMDDREADHVLDILASPFLNRAASKDWLVQRSHMSKVMRFTLVDPEARLFQVERWCFKGSIDNWFYLEGHQPLADLVRKYAKHLGKESFFDLM